MKKILTIIITLITLITCTGCKDEHFAHTSEPKENTLSTSTLYIVGSSTMELMNDEFIRQSKGYDIKVLNFAQSGEKIYTNCLRIGALPGNVKFHNHVLETNTNNYLTIDWPIDTAMRSFEASINSINGTLGIDNKGYYFRPTSEYQVKDLDVNLYYPITSKINVEEDSIFVLNLGKNDLLSKNDNDKIFYQLNSCIDFIQKNYSDKIYLINHFSTTDANKDLILNIEMINTYMYHILPSQYLDLNKYIASRNIWIDSKINPNQQDLDSQINFKLPPSLSRDNIHLNNETNIVIVNKIYEDLIKLKWIESKNLN